MLDELKPRPNSSIAVFGAGNVGLAAVMAARLTGAVTIIAIDKSPERLALARELGATHAVGSGSDAVQHYTAAAPDLRGLGGSERPTDGRALQPPARPPPHRRGERESPGRG